MRQSGKQLKRRMEPVTTPWRSIETGSSGGRLPEDLLQQTSQRLSTLCVVAAALWTIALFIANLLPHGAVGADRHPYPWPGNLIGGLAIAVAIAVFVYVRRSSNCQRKLDLGLFFLVANAFAIGLLNEWSPSPFRAPSVSWISVVILTYAMIAPSTPVRTLVAGLAAASMDPLGLLIADLRGLPTLAPAEMVVFYWPNYAAAVLAVVPSQVLHRLGRQIRRAREAGSYELVELLGKGGMGEVWRAEHRLLARPAAVKIIRPEVLGAAGDAEIQLIIRRFQREAQATSVLCSPHTIDVYDFGVTSEGAFYYVMELLVGCDLESLVRRFGPLPADRTVHLLRQVCHSLAEAHRRDLVHRDIKPANIYVCRMGLDYDFVKVLDFGLVKFGGRKSMRTSMMTTNHVTFGTPAYMAPEIILGESDVDRRADVYALGCLAYWMLTGHLVFEAENPMKMFVEHLQGKPVPPSERTELKVPPELDRLIMRCLEKDPADRPQDAEELFEMACGCKSCTTWDQQAASRWWELNLPELTRPTTLVQPISGLVAAASAGSVESFAAIGNRELSGKSNPDGDMGIVAARPAASLPDAASMRRASGRENG
jgi:eukaryotic-like serine/threonine-protein kinase